MKISLFFFLYDTKAANVSSSKNKQDHLIWIHLESSFLSCVCHCHWNILKQTCILSVCSVAFDTRKKKRNKFFSSLSIFSLKKVCKRKTNKLFFPWAFQFSHLFLPAYSFGSMSETIFASFFISKIFILHVQFLYLSSGDFLILLNFLPSFFI